MYAGWVTRTPEEPRATINNLDFPSPLRNMPYSASDFKFSPPTMVATSHYASPTTQAIETLGLSTGTSLLAAVCD